MARTSIKAVAVVGAGVIGSSIALALLRRGFDVVVLERSPTESEAPGQTGVASWAAAGILGAQVATAMDGPLARLAVASRDLYPDFVRQLERETGLDVELRPCGLVRPAFTRDELAGFEACASWQVLAGLRVERLDAAAVMRAEPAIGPSVIGGLRFPDEARIDPPKLLAALRRAVVARGGELRFGAHVGQVHERSGRAAGVTLADGVAEADAVVIAAGSWSAELDASSPALPARGQIVELRLDRPVLGGVVEGAEAYLSPRDDGRVIVGSTVELVGHERRVTAGALRKLLDAALRMVPSLEDATFSRAWAGFRPRAPDELPRIGRAPTPGLFVATGHHRNGVLLAPITAEAIARLIADEPGAVDLAPFSPRYLH